MRNDVSVHRVVKNIKMAGQYIEPHRHNFFYYIYCLSGHTCVRVGQERFETGPRSLVLVPPEICHSITSLDTSCCLDLKFTCSRELEERVKKLPLFFASTVEPVGSMVRDIFEEAINQNQDYDEVISLRLYELLISLMRWEHKEMENWQLYDLAAQREDPEMRKILQMIEENIDSPLWVKDLAARCGYSANYFRLIFRERVGVPPNRYINHRKIERAKELMLYSELNVSQIAEKLSYQSIHYFSRLFKQMTGIPPSEYIDRVKSDRPVNVIYNQNTPEGEFEIPLRNGIGSEPSERIVDGTEN